MAAFAQDVHDAAGDLVAAAEDGVDVGVPVEERSNIFDRNNALIGFDDTEYRAAAMDPETA